MAEDIAKVSKPRKILSLKKEKAKSVEEKALPKFLRPDISVYMVWCPDGEMPKRVYRADEQDKAISHAKRLAVETGRRFYVMRSWRGFEKNESADV